MWGACWLTLNTVQATPILAAPARGAGMDLVLMVAAAQPVTLTGELVRSSVLPFLPLSALLGPVQALNSSFGSAARGEITAPWREERLALCFSSRRLWLLDA